MGDFLQSVSEFIAKNELIDTQDKVVVGFSGGPDSVALLRNVALGRGTAQWEPLAAPLLRGDGPGDPLQGAGRRGAPWGDRRPAPALRPALAGPTEDISPPGDRPLLRAHGAVVLGGLPRQP